MSSLVAMAIGFALTAANVDAQQQATRAGVLRPGLVVDAVGGVAYVMAPTGGIAAVDLTSGAARWTSTAAGKPLALVGNLLVAQVEPRRQTNRLEVVTLRTQARGVRASRDTVVLPAGVRVSLGETLHGTFKLTAEPAGADVILHWTFVATPVRGIDEEPDSLTRERALAAQPATRRGALRLRVSSGRLTPLDRTGIAPREPQWALPAEAKVSGAAPTQYASADGRHVLASERVADDRVWDKYRWTVFERAGARRVGELRTHISFAPFVVRDSLVVFETTPYARAGQEPEPAKLRAFSLAGGREVWSVPVREVVFRGAYPP